MALIDIEQIKVNTIVKGTNCPICGGDLIPVTLKSLRAKLIGIVSMGIVKIHNYKCNHCGKEFHLF